jgi:GMP synthase (glutamine-hydrolysing)
MTTPSREAIVILDFGSQYSQLIARRVRELEVYCELLPHNASPEEINRLNPRGYILSGGPASVYEKDAPRLADFVLNSQKPILGICYGMQLLTNQLGGRVDASTEREYGLAEIEWGEEAPAALLSELPSRAMPVWMSHGDRVTRLPAGFRTLAHSKNSPYAAIGDPKRGIYGLQFHPEVTHTPQGKTC